MAIRIDDKNSAISYTNTWTTHGSSNEYESSVHLSRNKGATFSFTFTGTSVAVYGTISNSGVATTPAVSSYSIDGASGYTFSTPIPSTVQYQYRFFSLPQLAAGQHELVVTLTSDSPWYWLDYIEYTPVEETTTAAVDPGVSTTKDRTTVTTTQQQQTANVQGTTVTATTVTAQTSTKTVASSGSSQNIASSGGDKSSGTGTAQTGGITSSISQPSGIVGLPFTSSIDPAASEISGTSDLSTPGASRGSDTPVGAIVGGVVGGVVILLVLLFLIFRHRRRKRLLESRPELTPFGIDNAVSSEPTSPAVMLQVKNPFRSYAVAPKQQHRTGFSQDFSERGRIGAAHNYAHQGSAGGNTSYTGYGYVGDSSLGPSGKARNGYNPYSSTSALMNAHRSESPHAGMDSGSSGAGTVGEGSPRHAPTGSIGTPASSNNLTSYVGSGDRSTVYTDNAYANIGDPDDVPPAYQPPHPHSCHVEIALAQSSHAGNSHSHNPAEKTG